MFSVKFTSIKMPKGIKFVPLEKEIFQFLSYDFKAIDRISEIGRLK